MALGPRLDQTVLQRLELARLSSERLLLVLTLRGGIMRTIFVEVPSSIADDELGEVSVVLNERLAGLSLREIRASLAARLAACNAIAVAKRHLGSLDRVTRVVRLGVAVAASGDVRELPRVADGASELLQEVFGEGKNPSRLVYGVASLPLGTPVELELIFEVS